jgi:soluble lytic murein transglycosylase
LLLGFGLVALVSVASGASPPWRLEVTPRSPAELALRQAVERAGSVETLDALSIVAAEHEGTATAGLARLRAGVLLLEDERPTEALVQLAHSDVQRTALRDHALLATARVQDELDRLDAAAQSYRGAAAVPETAVACVALPRAAEILDEAGRLDEAATVLEDIVSRCSDARPQALADLAEVQIHQGQNEAAAATLDRLDRDYPTSPAARTSLPKLRALSRYLPPRSPAQQAQRTLERGEALLDAVLTREALETLRALKLGDLPPGEVDRARLALGRALLARRRRTEGHAVLGKIPPGSPLAAEAGWYAARDQARRGRAIPPYVALADAFPGTEWAQRGLHAAANDYQLKGEDEKAVPYWQRLLDEYPDGLFTETASWRVGWSEYRAKRFGKAARTWETTARLRPPTTATAGLLYWAARSHLALGEQERARWLLDETVQRFKHTYHGMRAQEQLARLGLTPTPAPPPPGGEGTDPGDTPSGPRARRLRELLLVDLFDEAAAELRLMGDSRRVRATLAWVEWRRGRFRPAITVMKRAYPWWESAAGDHLPDGVWRILVPLQHEDELVRQAREEGLDPALVAGLIMQESTFDPRARSRAGARGLMQIMPATGRGIARQKRVRFSTSSLYDPSTSLDFGTFYLRQISDRFDGAVERVLAGYNAGPNRVGTWTTQRPGMSEEEFIETIPFTETRFYVRLVLANRAQYRRIYGLGLEPGPIMGGTPE